VFSTLAILISRSVYDRLGCSRSPLPSVPHRARVFSALPPLITTTRVFPVVILRSELGYPRLCFRSLQRLGRYRPLSSVQSSGVLGFASAHYNDSGVLGLYLAYLRYRFLTHPRSHSQAAHLDTRPTQSDDQSLRLAGPAPVNQASASPRVTSRRRVRIIHDRSVVPRHEPGSTLGFRNSLYELRAPL